jgi:hypothetical protein
VLKTSNKWSVVMGVVEDACWIGFARRIKTWGIFLASRRNFVIALSNNDPYPTQ